MADFKQNDHVIISQIADHPEMIVESVNGDDVTCIWKVGSAIKRDTFKAGVLAVAPPPAPATPYIGPTTTISQQIAARVSRRSPVTVFRPGERRSTVADYLRRMGE